MGYSLWPEWLDKTALASGQSGSCSPRLPWRRLPQWKMPAQRPGWPGRWSSARNAGPKVCLGKPTCLFTRPESLAWSQQCFWQLNSCQFMKRFCGLGNCFLVFNVKWKVTTSYRYIEILCFIQIDSGINVRRGTAVSWVVHHKGAVMW